jgi:hypothetical protein
MWCDDSKARGSSSWSDSSTAVPSEDGEDTCDIDDIPSEDGRDDIRPTNGLKGVQKQAEKFVPHKLSKHAQAALDRHTKGSFLWSLSLTWSELGSAASSSQITDEDIQFPDGDIPDEDNIRDLDNRRSVSFQGSSSESGDDSIKSFLSSFDSAASELDNLVMDEAEPLNLSRHAHAALERHNQCRCSLFHITDRFGRC